MTACKVAYKLDDDIDNLKTEIKQRFPVLDMVGNTQIDVVYNGNVCRVGAKVRDVFVDDGGNSDDNPLLVKVLTKGNLFRFSSLFAYSICLGACLLLVFAKINSLLAQFVFANFH